MSVCNCCGAENINGWYKHDKECHWFGQNQLCITCGKKAMPTIEYCKEHILDGEDDYEYEEWVKGFLERYRNWSSEDPPQYKDDF